MEVLRPADARAFLDVAGRLLTEDEARHNLILGIVGTLEAHPDVYLTFHLWVVIDGDGAVAAAAMTPPYNLVIADPASDDGLDALLRAVRQDGVEVPGLVGNLPAVDRAASAWATATGTVAHRIHAHGVYALTAVRDVVPAAGAPRPATPDDRALLEAWLTEFAAEALPQDDTDDDRMQRAIELRLSSEDDSGFWIWEEGGVPVSLVGYGGPAGSGIRIGPVYTPVEYRRRGYATNAVAILSRWLLERGYRACFLYTDLANPTSNKIYTQIGYELVCDSAEFRFLPP